MSVFNEAKAMLMRTVYIWQGQLSVFYNALICISVILFINFMAQLFITIVK